MKRDIDRMSSEEVPSARSITLSQVITATSLPNFLSSLLAGKRDIVSIFVRCMCVRLSGFVRTITCTIMHGFQNKMAQLLPLRRRSAI